MKVRPKNYTWTALYDRVIDLRKYSFSMASVGRRVAANKGFLTKSLNLVRALSVRRFFEGDTPVVSTFYADRVRRDLGALRGSFQPPMAALAT